MGSEMKMVGSESMEVETSVVVEAVSRGPRSRRTANLCCVADPPLFLLSIWVIFWVLECSSPLVRGPIFR